jgi:hypothetical protein
MKKKKEIDYDFIDYRKYIKDDVDLDQRIEYVEDMCVEHILKHKNIIYSPINRDTIFITNKLQGLFFYLINLLNEKVANNKGNEYDYYAKYNPDKYNENSKIPNIKGTRTAGYVVYGSTVDIRRDIEYNHENDYRKILLDLLKNNIFTNKKKIYLKFYEHGKNVDIAFLKLSEYMQAHLDVYKEEHETNIYFLIKKRDSLMNVLDRDFDKTKRVWRIELNHVELGYIQYLFYLRQYTIFKDMRPFMRERYEQYFETCAYHGFQVFFLFENILFAIFFLITQDVDFYFPTRSSGQLVYVDSDGVRYHLAETTKSVRRSLNEAQEYLTDYLEETDNILINVNNMLYKFKDDEIINESNDVFDRLENKLKIKDFFFKTALENIAKNLLIENIMQKD